MTKQPPPSYTDRQLTTLIVLQRTRLAGIMFWFLLAVFLIVLGLFVYAAFFTEVGATVKVILGLLDAIIGFGFKPLISYLYSTTTLNQKPTAALPEKKNRSLTE